ncbi:MAG: GIY-YIG nuclease family protein [Rikenellaceae bacterium]|nr:GIY-YIG nuclease family protein [Rikenellaceae bacterium]
MKKNGLNNSGIVYVLTNPAMPGIVKIGMTNRDNIEERMRELFSTGVPVPFECNYACTVSAKDCPKIEKALHQAFAPSRVHPVREFFRIDPMQAVAILELFDRKEITEEVNREIDEDLTTEDKASRARFKRRQRPALDFLEMGIPVGAVIRFGEGSDVPEAEVCSPKKILHHGEEYSLSALTRKIKNLDHNIAPCPHWYYNGRCLSDIYDETYPIEEE